MDFLRQLVPRLTVVGYQLLLFESEPSPHSQGSSYIYVNRFSVNKKTPKFAVDDREGTVKGFEPKAHINSHIKKKNTHFGMPMWV
jgi:hypothetical protein